MALRAVLLASCLVALVAGHSYMVKPRGRDSWKWNDCRWGGPDFSIKYCASIPNAKEAGPCEKPYQANQQHHSAQRGDAFRVEWPRNNHPGGFVRLSWLPTSQTELPNAHELFDGNAWVYTCFERVCHADEGPNGWNGDSLGTDGGCWIDLNIPDHLTNGAWTLQWTWYGGMWGDAGDYYTCANFNIQGGNPVTAKPQPKFIGGDAGNPNDNGKCRYFTTNRLHYCWFEPCKEICKANTAPAGNCGWPAMNGPAYIDPPINPAPATTGVATTGVATTGVATTGVATTGVVTTGTVITGPKVTVIVTASVSTPPSIFDITTFVYAISNILDIPTGTIEEIQINLDQSTPERTAVTFKMINAVGSNGQQVNPIAAAEQLKQLVESNDPRLQSAQYAILNGLQVIDADSETTVVEEASSAMTLVYSAATVLVLLALLF